MKLKLSKYQLEVLHRILGIAIASRPLEELKSEPNEYVVISAVFELFDKLDKKERQLRFFGSAKDAYSVSVSRTQALALDLLLNPHSESSLVKIQEKSYEWNLAREICDTIYQKYYV